MRKTATAQGTQSVTASNNASSEKVQATVVQVPTYQEIRKESQKDREERELQYEVEDNLRNLMADISATNRELQSVIRSRQSYLQTSSVNWSSLAECDKKIEGYEKGLARLKSYRDCYFPNWRELTTAE